MAMNMVKKIPLKNFKKKIKKKLKNPTKARGSVYELDRLRKCHRIRNVTELDEIE